MHKKGDTRPKKKAKKGGFLCGVHTFIIARVKDRSTKPVGEFSFEFFAPFMKRIGHTTKITGMVICEILLNSPFPDFFVVLHMSEQTFDRGMNLEDLGSQNIDILLSHALL